MKKLVRTVSVLICAATVLFSGTAVYAADRYTPSGVAYGDIGSTIENWASENPNEYVSFVTSVFDKDEVLYEGAFGYVDRENNIAAGTDSVYEWGSISKLTVWVSVMQLYEQGRIDLNADVRNYLPDGFFQKLKYDDPVTMLNLMNHDAGWGESTWALQVASSDEIVPLGQALRDTEPPQIYRPGEVCSYSNWGAALAGYIVECITGESYADYVHKNIFEPLGMEHTAILPDHSDNQWVMNKRQELYSYSNIDGTTWNNNGKQLVYINIYPAGACTGTISDLAKFAQSFVSDDCPLFAKKETRDLLLSPSSFLGDTGIVCCCHGLWPEYYENAQTIGHPGGTNACASNLLVDTETGIGVVFMTAGGTEAVSELIFGQAATPDLSNCTSQITSQGNMAGMYGGTRAIRRGFFKFYGILSMMPVTYKDNNEYDVGGMATIYQVSDDVFVLEQSNKYPGCVYQTSDGTKILTLGMQSFTIDNTIIPSLVLLAVFIVMAVAGVVCLMIKLIGRLARKYEGYKGSLLITLSQIFRVICLVPPIWLIPVYSDQYGITHQQGYIFFGVEAACFAVFAATLISSVLGLFSKSENAGPKYKYVMSILGNGVAIVMMLLLEFLNIRGI